MSGGLLDSPEIVKITKSIPLAGDGVTHLSYNDTGVLGGGGKFYTAVFKFTDAAGRVHRSAPATPLFASRTDAGTGNVERVLVEVTPPIVLQREKGTLYLEVYESQAGGPFQLTGTSIVNESDATQVTQLGVDTVGEGKDYYGSRTAPLLYTEGNVLAGDPWPNFDFVVQSGRRMFAHAIGDPSTVFYSKVFEQNVAPEFSAQLSITLGNNIITALGTIDDKTIAFTEDGMWVIYGTGPDNTGANGDFFVEKLTHQVGCEDQRSVLSVRDGIVFYSRTTGEFHLLTRDMNVIDLAGRARGQRGSLVRDARHGGRVPACGRKHRTRTATPTVPAERPQHHGGRPGLQLPPRQVERAHGLRTVRRRERDRRQ